MPGKLLGILHLPDRELPMQLCPTMPSVIGSYGFKVTFLTGFVTTLHALAPHYCYNIMSCSEEDSILWKVKSTSTRRQIIKISTCNVYKARLQYCIFFKLFCAGEPKIIVHIKTP